MVATEFETLLLVATVVLASVLVDKTLLAIIVALVKAFPAVNELLVVKYVLAVFDEALPGVACVI